MKFGIAFANAGPATNPEFAVEFAQLAEELGFESLWTVEHVVVPAGYESAYPYSKDGRMPGGEDVPVPDPLIWLAYIAAATKRINLATGILILPQRNPLVLAKECATLDVLSGGRLILGIGVGWLKEEFDALGFPFEDRAATTDEHAAALRAVWGSNEATFNGAFSSFERVKSNPKPFGGRSIPIHVGGHTAAAARRAGRLGDGFFPASPKDLPALLNVMRAAADDAGRDADAIEITTSAGRTVDDMKALADMGVHRASVSPMGSDMESIKRRLGAFSETVIGPLS